MKKLILLLFLTGQLQAATYHIATTGNNSTTCANADFGTTARAKLTIMGATGGLQCLASGDTLIIHAGTYPELLTTLGNAYMPSGASEGTRTIIQGNTGETIITNGIDVYSRSFITVKNIITNGYSNHIGRASTVSTCGSSIVGDCNPSTNILFDTVEARNWAPGASSSGGGGFNLGFHQESISSNLRLLNCISHNNGGNHLDHGVYVQARDSIVEGGSYYNNTGHGVHIYSSTSGAANNSVVKNVRAYANGSYGIGLYSSSNLSAYNNLIYGNGIINVGSGGISLRLGGRGAIYSNTVYNNTGYGIRNEDYATNIIKNNIAYLNSGANLNYTVTPTNSNNIVANPLFVDTTNFELGAGSPAIGAGVDLSATIGNTDFDGTVRTGGWDVGAQEVSIATESLTLLTPNGGTLGVTGSSQTLTYGSSGIANVRLRYSPNGIAFTSPVSLSASTTATGSFPFTAPAAGSTYRFEVCKTDGTLCSYSSADVIITASAGGTLTKIISNNTIGTKIGDIPGVEDNSITKSTPTTNRGSETPVGVYKYASTSHAHTLIRFTGFSQIPSTAGLTSCSLCLFVQGGAGASSHDFDIRRVIRTWGPATATWNTYDGINPWTTAGALGAATDRNSTVLAQITGVTLANQYRCVTQTSGALFDWAQGVINLSIPNQGLHIERSGAGEETPGQYRDITSSEGIDGQRPSFSVTYTVTTPTITLTQPTAGEQFYLGDTMAIRWQSSEFSGNVISTLSLNNGASYDNTIVASHPFDQPDATWVYALSPTISASTQAKVKVCSITNPTVCSESQAFNLAGNRR